ncbi:hypothetical protein SLS56_001816 [Neofusicoccum ribis]|uniref:Helicase C-terminal domain-containing protein n=1 Tax=Neofusicoccum ribis TaxID=45134 RepID=A0ABR3T749_9PEZI
MLVVSASSPSPEPASLSQSPSFQPDSSSHEPIPSGSRNRNSDSEQLESNDEGSETDKKDTPVNGSTIIARNLVKLGTPLEKPKEKKMFDLISKYTPWIYTLPSLGRPSCKSAKLIRCRSALNKGWNVIIDKPLSYNDTVAIYLALCIRVLLRLKLSGELPNVVGNEQEDPRKAGIDYSSVTVNAEPTGDLTHILFPDAELIDVEAARRALANCRGSDGGKTGTKAAVAISDDEHCSMVEKEKEKGPAIVIDSDSSSDSEDDLPLAQKNGSQNGKANGKGTFVNRSPGVGDSKPRAGNPPSFLSTAATDDYQDNDDNSDSEDDIPLAHWNRLQNRDRSTARNNSQEACSNNNIHQRGSSGYQNRSSAFEAWIKTTKNYGKSHSSKMEENFTCQKKLKNSGRLAKKDCRSNKRSHPYDKNSSLDSTLSFPSTIESHSNGRADSPMDCSTITERNIQDLSIPKGNNHTHPSIGPDTFMPDRVDDQTQFFLFGPWWDQHELNLAEQFLNSREPNSKKLVHHTGKAFFNPKVKYPKHDLKSRRPANLKHLFDKLGNVEADRKTKILILCRSHEIVDALWRHVSTRGVAKRMHLTDRVERDNIAHQWSQGTLRALVTTEDLAEGLTMLGVTEVVHWELPRHENLNVAEWKYVRRMDRVRDEVERTSVFFADEDVDLFQLVAKVATGFLHGGNLKAHHAWVYRSYMRQEWGLAVEEKPKWR